MAGCGGNCTCKAERSEAPREPSRLADAIARIAVDNKVIARTVELYELGVVRLDDLVAQINADKNNGLI